MQFVNFGVELYYDETKGISSINYGLLHFVHNSMWLETPYESSIE